MSQSKSTGGGGSVEGTAVLSTGESVTKFLRSDGDNSSSWQAVAAGSFGIGEVVTGGNEGSVLFIDSVDSLQEDNANFFWDADNIRLGIGGTPTKTLHVLSTGSTPFKIETTNANCYIALFASGTSGGQYINSTGEQMELWTNNTQAVTIDSSQNVGIGTAVPSTILHIADSEPCIRLEDTNDDYDFDIRVDGKGFNIREVTASNAYRLTIEPITGNVGIGTSIAALGATLQIGDHTNTMPSNTALFIDGTGGQTLRFSGTNDNADYGAYLKPGYDTTTTPNTSVLTLGTRFTSDTDVLTLRGSNVGIGTTTPTRQLHIKDTSGDVILGIDADSGSGDSVLALRNDAKIWNVGIDNSDDDKLVFAQGGSWNNIAAGAVMTLTTGGDCQWYNTSAAAKMTWDASSARLGIGTESPAVSLHIKTTSDADQQLTLQNSVVSYYIGVSDTSANRFVGSSNSSAFLGTAGAHGLEFATNNTVRATIDEAGLVGIGSTEPTAKLFIQGASTERSFQAVGGSTTIGTGYFYTNTIHTGTDTNATLSVRSDHADATGDVLHVQGAGTVNLLTLNKGGTDRLIITSDGAIGLGGAIYGTSGQVLTSAGSSAVPTWSSNIAGNAGTVTTNANLTGEVTSSGSNATTIADNIVDEANLKVSNTPTNGYMLTAQSGDTGGLTWAASGGSSGLILQVQGSSLVAATSTASETYVVAVSRAITPAATANNVLVSGNVNVGIHFVSGASVLGRGDFQLYRDSTALGLVQTLYSDDDMGATSYAGLSWSFYDSAISTTSAATYSIKYKTYDIGGSDDGLITLSDAQITLQEVSG